MAFKPIDPKRDEFRRYLERSGVLEALTKVFVRIVKERPENPLDYLRKNLGDSLHQADNLAYLQSELEEAQHEIQRLRGIIESVNPDALQKDQSQQPPQGKEFIEESIDNQEKTNELVANEHKDSSENNREVKEKETQNAVQKASDTVQENDLAKPVEVPEGAANSTKSVVQSDPISAKNADNNS